MTTEQKNRFILSDATTGEWDFSPVMRQLVTNSGQIILQQIIYKTDAEGKIAESRWHPISVVTEAGLLSAVGSPTNGLDQTAKAKQGSAMTELKKDAGDRPWLGNAHIGTTPTILKKKKPVL